MPTGCAACNADPTALALVLKVRDHMRAEILGELDPLMATLTQEPVYHFWGNGDPVELRGGDVIRGFYHDMFRPRR